MKKALVGVGLFAVTMGLSASAWAAPNPNPNAPEHTVTACVRAGGNQNTDPNGPISLTGWRHFADVGVAMCGLVVP